MRVLGIVAEYNPFHNGHLYHLKKSVSEIRPDYTVVVMSGNFTQRGEATIVDKWARTEMAIRCGADLVLELPVVYATQTAELFAFGSIQTLNNTGVVTHISFGSETDELLLLDKIAGVLAWEPPLYRSLLKNFLNRGLSFPAARLEALMDYFDRSNCSVLYHHKLENIMKSPNSILAIEYLKALKRTKSTIEPFAIKRTGASYNSRELAGRISSATAIRRELLSRGCTERISESLPEVSYRILKDRFESGMAPVTNGSFDQLILGILRRTPAEEIKNWMDVEEGLENRLKECSLSACTVENLLERTKTRRYVYTRLQRILIHGLLGITKSKMKKFNSAGGPRYLRILGFSRHAGPLLREMKKAARVPIISKPAHYRRFNDELLCEMFEIDVLATDLYSLGMRKKEYRVGGRDFTEKIVIV